MENFLGRIGVRRVEFASYVQTLAHISRTRGQVEARRRA